MALNENAIVTMKFSSAVVTETVIIRFAIIIVFELSFIS
jgi:hypothetical protein